MHRLRITVRFAFRQARIEITNESLDVRELLVEIIKPKRRFLWVSTLKIITGRSPLLLMLLVLEGTDAVVVFIFLDNLILNLLETEEWIYSRRSSSSLLLSSKPYISALTVSRCSALAANWQIDDALCPRWGAVVDTRRNLYQIQSYICDAVQPMLWEDNHCWRHNISLQFNWA